MKIYRFFRDYNGLQSILEQRLRVSLLQAVNDPYELRGFWSSDEITRTKLDELVEWFSQKYGVLCFSDNAQNPLMWSHYADSHKGLCLCFDVEDSSLFTTVKYADSPIEFSLPKGRYNKVDYVLNILSTKSIDWSYEREKRFFIRLDNKDKNGSYFVNFGDEIRLKEVIVGARHQGTLASLENAVGRLTGVEVRKASLRRDQFLVEY